MKAACRTARRPDHVRPELPPLLLGDHEDVPSNVDDDNDPDQLAAVRGIFFWTLMSTAF